MRRAVLVIAGLVLGAPVADLAAQNKGTFEIGGFGRYTISYDDSYMTVDESRDKWGGGARIGYFIADGFALELDGNANPMRSTSAASAAHVTPQTASSRRWKRPYPISSIASFSSTRLPSKSM